MNEIDELKEEAQELVREFADIPIVQEYLSLKKAISNDPKLNEYLKIAKSIRKKIGATSNHDEQLALIEEARHYEKLYYDDPKVVNLANIKEELDILLKEVSNLFN